MARPSSFTQAKADIICERIAKGESLRAICADDDMPDRGTVIKWLAKNELTEFHSQYARARETQADSLFDEVLEIADDGTNDWMQRHNFDGNESGWHVNGEAQARSRLRIDARKWMAGKLQPKKYGEKLQHTGADGTGPVETTTTLVITGVPRPPEVE